MDKDRRQEQIAQYLAAQKQKISPAQTITPHSSTNTFPLSYGQERLWFLYQLEKENPTYNRPTILHLRGKLDRTVLNQCLNHILVRHQTLRTTYQLIDGEPMAILKAPSEVLLPVDDLTDYAYKEKHDITQHRMDETIDEPFNLETGPIFRVHLYKLDEREHRFLFVIHHILFDAWSENILINEIASLYTSIKKDRKILINALPIQYADYVFWQREGFEHGRYQRQMTYWVDRLNNASSLNLPLDRDRPVKRTNSGSSVEFKIPTQVVEALKKLNQLEETTLFMTLLAGYLVLLHRYTGDRDIIIGTAIAGRKNQETQKTIGLFINTLALRFGLDGNLTLKELLRKVRKTTLEAYSNASLPFDKIVEEVQVARNLLRDPFIQVFFNLENIPEPAKRMDDVQIERITPETRHIQFDLSMDLQTADNSIQGSLEYNAALFEHETIERMVKHYLLLLERMGHDSDQKIGYLDFMTDAERKLILYDWNDTVSPFSSDLCLHQLFENQVRATPDAIALVFNSLKLTYDDLNRRSNQVAHFLSGHGVHRGSRVGIFMPKSPKLITVLIGVMKTGAAYVPLDPTLPRDYLIKQAQEAQLQVIINGFLAEDLSGILDGSIIQIEEIIETLSKEPSSNPGIAADPEDLIYITYTSGTTGRPKGVPIRHRSVVNYLEHFTRYCELRSNDSVLQVPAISFDASVEDIFGTLTSGATLFLLEDQSVTDMKQILGLLEQEGITCVLSTVPSFWRAFFAYAENHPVKSRNMRLITVSGEVLYGSDCIKLRQIFGPQLTLVNTFGPTESTIVATYYQVPQEIDPEKAVYVGRPIQNYQVYILDDYLSPVPLGVVGDLYIGGEGLAIGYLYQPGVTATSFIPNPFSNKPGDRLYHTGDRVRYLPDGTLEFIGRSDRQVKIRGKRVEIGEVEAVLRTHPKVFDCAVTSIPEKKLETTLIAYITSGSDQEIPATPDLRSYLQDKMPDYMVPSIFIPTDNLPLTSTGKINYQELPLPETQPLGFGDETLPPTTETEQLLTKIWGTHLGMEPIGIRDDFFDLGGHSLMAIRIMADIEKTFGIEIPLAILFQATTIADLASYIEGATTPTEVTTLIPVQPQGTKPPLFCVPPAAATAMRFERLSKHLGLDQPLYGFNYPGMDGKLEPIYSIPELANTFINDLQTKQPSGPYSLCGMCYGGNVAFEMAHQLTAQGHCVSFLGIIDANFAPKRRRTLRYFLYKGRMFFVERILKKETKPGGRVRMNRRWESLWTDPSNRTLLKVFEANIIARLEHKITPYPGKIMKFSTNWEVARHATREWRKMTTVGLDDHFIPGTHQPASAEETGILGEKNIAAFTKIFKNALESTR